MRLLSLIRLLFLSSIFIIAAISIEDIHKSPIVQAGIVEDIHSETCYHTILDFGNATTEQINILQKFCGQQGLVEREKRDFGISAGIAVVSVLTILIIDAVQFIWIYKQSNDISSLKSNVNDLEGYTKSMAQILASQEERFEKELENIRFQTSMVELFNHNRIPTNFLDEEMIPQTVQQQMGMNKHLAAKNIVLQPMGCQGKQVTAQYCFRALKSENAGILCEMSHIGKFTNNQSFFRYVQIPQFAILLNNGSSIPVKKDDCVVKNSFAYCEPAKTQCSMENQHLCNITTLPTNSHFTFSRNVRGMDLIATLLKKFTIVFSNGTMHDVPINSTTFMMKLQSNSTAFLGHMKIEGKNLIFHMQNTQSSIRDHSSEELKILEKIIKRTGQYIQYPQQETEGILDKIFRSFENAETIIASVVISVTLSIIANVFLTCLGRRL